jgi:hypothetical protein
MAQLITQERFAVPEDALIAPVLGHASAGGQIVGKEHPA